jgi:aryl-alcohol dehydrogenase-like predicted oxidoreductase
MRELGRLHQIEMRPAPKARCQNKLEVPAVWITVKPNQSTIAMKQTRRQFLEATTLAAGSLILGARCGVVAAEAAAKPAFNASDLVPLGKSGLKVSRLCLGTGMRGGKRQSNHTRLGTEKFNALVRGALERGVRFFDLADLYGSHSFFADAVQGTPRSEYSIVTKIWWNSGGIPEPERPDADVVVKRFLGELKTDYLDMVLLHCVTSAKWPEELRKQMDLLAGLKKKGVIRAHGVSCHSLPALQAAAKEPWVDSIHARINPYGVKMDGTPEEILAVLREARANGKGVVGMKIVGEGEFRNDPEKRKKSVQLALQCGCVDSLLVGCESLAEIDDIRQMMAGTSGQ